MDKRLENYIDAKTDAFISILDWCNYANYLS